MTLQQPFFKLAVLAAALTVACAAEATPYAFGSISFTNLQMTGLNSNNVTALTTTTKSDAGYPTSPSGVSRSGTTDVLQSYAGPGPFPAENTFTQALQSSFGTRGDALITGNLLTNPAMTAAAVAEGRLAPLGGTLTAASSGGTSTGMTFNFSTGGPATLCLTFNASDLLVANTNAIGDGASAAVSSSFSVVGTDNSYSESFAPKELNASTSSTFGNGNGLISNASKAYSYQFNLGPGTYQFSFLTGAQQFLQDPSAVPEPTPLALLGIGALGFGIARTRKNRKQA